ncbi:DUF7268 family protein [Haloparvum sp. PAK95]|uniref:DUF7268 family protein n=1 Tax=Haloparvum sp. PAK95 TaxID=3418962 RepID=UPI003D2F517B
MGPGDQSRQQERPGLRDALIRRARLVGTAVGVGAVAGSVAVVILTLVGAPGYTDSVFLAGTLAFGFGLLGWSGSAMAGRGIEAMQTYLATGSNWTERKSRRAMARVGGFGFGLMVGSAITGTLI